MALANEYETLLRYLESQNKGVKSTTQFKPVDTLKKVREKVEAKKKQQPIKDKRQVT